MFVNRSGQNDGWLVYVV